jgi:hypothetical protein
VALPDVPGFGIKGLDTVRFGSRPDFLTCFDDMFFSAIAGVDLAHCGTGTSPARQNFSHSPPSAAVGSDVSLRCRWSLLVGFECLKFNGLQVAHASANTRVSLALQ